MKNESIESLIKKMFNSMKPTAFFCWLKKNSECMDEIVLNTQKLNGFNLSLRTRLYWYFNCLTDFPKCEVCGKPMTRDIINMAAGYNRTCSKACAFADKKRNQKISGSLKSRTEDQKAGTLEKTKKTCLENYGVEYSFQSENNKSKSRIRCMEKYGVPNAMMAECVRSKMKKNNLEKYGVENVYEADWCKDKIRKRCSEKYGVDHPMKNAGVKEKAASKMRIARREKSWERNILGCAYDRPAFTRDFYILNYNRDLELEFRCVKCGNAFKSKHYEGFHDKCPKCYPHTASVSERDVCDYIKTIYGGNVIMNTKRIISPLELDIYVPEKKLAIEYDGLYWHAFENANKTHGNRNYHLDKTVACEKNGIRLIHIFEDEWKNKNKIVKSRLASVFGKYERTAFARNCAVKCVDSAVADCFLNENHLQGSAKASVRLGLYCGDSLVSLMTFSKCRLDKKHEWELVRFCSRIGYHVPGAAGKLLKHFERNYAPVSIVTYADRRWSDGNLYAALGFDFVHFSKPNYWYIPEGGHDVRLNRMAFQKHALAKKLKNFNQSLSEYQNMRNAGYETIYDCGNYVFQKILKPSY